MEPFINPHVFETTSLLEYNQMYQNTNIVTIPNFINHNVLRDIKPQLENYEHWMYSIMPNNHIWTTQKEPDEPLKEVQVKECLYHLENKHFSYRFRRTYTHHRTCTCLSCQLNVTIENSSVIELLCKIVGAKHLTKGESFLSLYTKDDFLSLHHDIQKGDIAVTFSLTYDWHPTYGGILHFCDKNQNIYKSVVPKLGSVNIFKLDPENGIDHFVSCVNVQKNRYTYTAWYMKS
jgi:Rps23 Pro-64 3,4-dihydroxylase Tpa1-like proline 4-hydroxylase